jgi:hypothetical protein
MKEYNKAAKIHIYMMIFSLECVKDHIFCYDDRTVSAS